MTQKPRQARSVRRPALPEATTRRLPPGQFFTPRWPILHQGEIPPIDTAAWDFRISGLVHVPLILTWAEFRTLSVVSTTGDLHCVTRWSTLDHAWTGVLGRSMFEIAQVDGAARFVLLHGEGGYTANLRLATFLEDDVVLAFEHDGQALTAEHGGPLRAVVPGRYAWKSVKWLRGIEFMAEDRPGFWEEFGYSYSADPWQEERFES